MALVCVSVLALAMAGCAGWLFVERGRLSARLARAEAERDRSGEEAVRAREDGAREAERARVEAARERELAALELERLREGNEERSASVLRLSQELAALRERLENAELLKKELQAEMARGEARMREAFKSLSADALREGREEFLKQAGPVFEAAKKEQAELVRPIGEVLGETRKKLEEIEKTRTESFARMQEKLEGVILAGRDLRSETSRLTQALSRPEVRGQYGEIQLRRVAELAGMTSYCDFQEQASTRDGEGNVVRPDMIVRLPNERVVAVDAKTNTYAYLEAVNARDDQEREAHMDRFARHVAEQAKKLADKRYWSAWEGSPEFVVMFVPGDHFIDAALSRRPELLEQAASHGVILASPATLIGLLRAVAVGWREHRIAAEAQELLKLGRELHERAAVTFEHIEKLGSSIGQSVERFNKVVGSVEGRLLPTLRKFEDVGARSEKQISEMKPVESQARAVQGLLTDGTDGAAS